MAHEKKTANTDIDAASSKSTTSASREETRFVAPPVDIYETEDGVMVLADLPGIDIDDVDIRVENDRLTIRGRTSYAPVNASCLHSEFRLINFHRQFNLGSEVDQEKISAGVKDGVLTISLPKAERVKLRRIEVKVA